MKSIPRRIFDFLEVYLPAAIFVVLIGAVFLGVVFRYVFDDPIPQLFEISIYSFVWVIYLGAALATRYNQHMRFDLVYRKLPPVGRLLVDTIFYAVLNVVIGIIVYPTIAYAFSLRDLKASTLNISWTYLLVCFPIFMILVFIHNCAAIYYKIREIITGKARTEETPPWQ